MEIDVGSQLEFAPLKSVGAASYLVVAITRFLAWLITRISRSSGGEWAVVMAFFAFLSASRLVEIEDVTGHCLREFLCERGAIEIRHFL